MTRDESVPALIGREAERSDLLVVRLVAVGQTDKEIARELFLSPRTVETHVLNIRAKLDCRSRADAARRANELGLVVTPASP